MRAIFVCQASGNAVCAIDTADREVVVGRQAQFGIRDAACSRFQAKFELLISDSSSVLTAGSKSASSQLTVACVGAGKLFVGLRQLRLGEVAPLHHGDSLTLGESCKLTVRLEAVYDEEREGPSAKRARIDPEDDTESEEATRAAEIEHQLALLRQTAVSQSERSSKGSSQLNQSSKDAGHVDRSSKDVSQSERSSKDVSQSDRSPKDVSQSDCSPKDAKQSPIGWCDLGTVLVYTHAECRPSDKIAGFDLDGTLICTQSGRVFPKDSNDWQIIYPVVPGRLKSLAAEGYKVVLFSNQKGVEAGKVSVQEIKSKVERILCRLGVPAQAFLSVRGLRHRKPYSGMWHLLAREFNSGQSISAADSFYVGDAAGRPADAQKGRSGRKADFSCSDRLFALNCGLGAFHTPEEFFLGQTRFPADGCRMPEFRPPGPAVEAPDDAWPSSELRDLLSSALLPAEDEGPPLVLVLVGYPASGKSTLCRQLVDLASRLQSGARRLEVVSRDRLGTWQRCVQAAEAALKSPTMGAVLIDNTSVDVESRGRYVECARRCGARSVSLVLGCSLGQCLHNERYRRILEESGETEVKRKEPVNEMVFNQMRARFAEPQLSEGFVRVLQVPFVPRFQCDAHRRLYSEFLVEK